MIGEDRSIKDIDDATEIEKAIFPRHVPLFEIGLPELIRAGDNPMGGPDPGGRWCAGRKGCPCRRSASRRIR